VFAIARGCARGCAHQLVNDGRLTAPFHQAAHQRGRCRGQSISAPPGRDARLSLARPHLGAQLFDDATQRRDLALQIDRSADGAGLATARVARAGLAAAGVGGVATAGDTFLGGENYDKRLVDWLVQPLEPPLGAGHVDGVYAECASCLLDKSQEAPELHERTCLQSQEWRSPFAGSKHNILANDKPRHDLPVDGTVLLGDERGALASARLTGQWIGDLSFSQGDSIVRGIARRTHEVASNDVDELSMDRVQAERSSPTSGAG
jgi:hypothetical protein